MRMRSTGAFAGSVGLTWSRRLDQRVLLLLSKGDRLYETESIPGVTPNLCRDVRVWLVDLRACALQRDHRARGAQELRRHRDCTLCSVACCSAAGVCALTPSQADALVRARTDPPDPAGTTASLGD